MEDIIKVVKFLEESGLMTKGASETTENKVNEAKSTKKVGFLAFGGSLLVNLFSGKGEREQQSCSSDGVVQAGKNTTRAEQSF